MNMQKLMQEAAKMQRDITKKQEEINATNYEAQSGLVSIVLNGKKEIVSIKFDKNKSSLNLSYNGFDISPLAAII